MLLDYETIRNMLFFDIETVAEYETYEQLPPLEKSLWDKVSKRFLGDNYENESLLTKNECYRKNVGIYPEFSKVVTVSYGVAKIDIIAPENCTWDVREILAIDEKTVLLSFATVLNAAYTKNTNRILSGHNIAGFDIPFVIKRMLKHGIVIPTILINVIEAKPWEQKVYDTIRVWKFGSTEFVSLESICTFLGIETSKGGIVSGSSLNSYYYGVGDLNEKLTNISRYCTLDVQAGIKVVLRLAKH
jgi:DNA polymerase elongation subunit (family B)